MNKLMFSALLILMSEIAFAHGPCRPCPRPMPPHSHPAPHHWNHSSGNAFWGGFAEGVVGGIVGTALRPEPAVAVVQQPVVVQTQAAVPVVQTTVVQSPVAVQKQVWQPAHYEAQVQPNGAVVNVWVPGRYVVVQ